MRGLRFAYSGGGVVSTDCSVECGSNPDTEQCFDKAWLPSCRDRDDKPLKVMRYVSAEHVRSADESSPRTVSELSWIPYVESALLITEATPTPTVAFVADVVLVVRQPVLSIRSHEDPV